MATPNDTWIEANLQRQRKMLEDKQKQKRHQSAGSVRTTSTGLSMGSMNEYPTFDSTAPPLGYFSESMTSSASNINNFHPAPEAPPRSKLGPQASNSSFSTRAAPLVATEPLISFSDQSDQELSAKLTKAKLSSVVTSDDEQEDKNARDYSGVPWKSGMKADNIQTEQPPDFNYIKNNLSAFVDEPVSERCLYKCTITRQKNGVDKSMFPTYFLHLEEGDNDKKVKIFLLAARKRKKSTTANYLISCDPTNLSRLADGYCAKVRSNALGTHFTIYDRGANPKKTNNELSIRQELASVIYDTNVLGFKGPRKMTVIVPGIEPATTTAPALRLTIRPVQDKHTLLERYKSGDHEGIKVLQNKSPQWNDETQSYVLNFHGRVTQASVKNFQIIHAQSPEYIVMQFGRVSDDVFTMDFRYPLSVIQAFGIAMTSFHGKLACE